MLLRSLSAAVVCGVSLLLTRDVDAQLVFVTDQDEFTAAIVSGNTIELAANLLLKSELVISHVEHLTVRGNGYMVNAQNTSRCFSISHSSLHFQDITVENGLARGDDDGGGFGGGMLVTNSNITISGSYISNSIATAGGGGLALMKFSTANLLRTSIAGNAGGGVYIDISHVNMTSSNILYNTNSQVCPLVLK